MSMTRARLPLTLVSRRAMGAMVISSSSVSTAHILVRRAVWDRGEAHHASDWQALLARIGQRGCKSGGTSGRLTLGNWTGGAVMGGAEGRVGAGSSGCWMGATWGALGRAKGTCGSCGEVAGWGAGICGSGAIAGG